MFELAMLPRYTSIWNFIFLLVRDRTGQCQDVQKYDTGLTWMSANSKCGKEGLEHNATILTELSSLHHHTFWIGLGIYKILTPWMEVLGCYRLQNQRKIFITSSAGLCYWECKTSKYFTYKKQLQECMCLGNDINLWSKMSLQHCTVLADSDAALIHKVFQGFTTSGDNNWMCMTFQCTWKTATFFEENCNSTSGNIHGLCEDGKNSSNGQSWGLPYSKQLENCKTKNMLLVKSKICTNISVSSRAWTTIFREKIEVELPGENNKRVPVRCLSAIISETGLKDLQTTKGNCNIKLNWFICKNNSTTEQLVVSNVSTIKEKSDEEQVVHSKALTGAVAGGSAIAVTILLIVISVGVCRLRRIGPFNDKSVQKPLQLVNKPKNEETKTDQDVNRKQQVNHSYGIINDEMGNHNVNTNETGNISISYARVKKIHEVEDTYMESVDGEYDHFNLTDRRWEEPNQNTYDSNVGIPSCEDPTYDTTSSSRKSDSENVYNHSFSNKISGSDYNQTVSVMTEANVYDKAC